MKLPGIVLLFCLLAGTASASYDYTVYQPHNEYGAYYPCADGHILTLKNNPDAVKPTYQQVIEFLKEDKTDEIEYDSDTFNCVDYAETLHNNAEESGLKCGVVDVVYKKVYNSKIGGYNTYGHECNVFRLDDGSKLYVDCVQKDGIADVHVGDVYTVEDLEGDGVHEQQEVLRIHRYW